MYFNPRFGNMGLLALPFGLAAFLAGLYTALYVLSNILYTVITRGLNFWATGIPPHLALPRLDWFFFNTSMLTFLIVATLGLTLVAVLIGKINGSPLCGARHQAIVLRFCARLVLLAFKNLNPVEMRPDRGKSGRTAEDYDPHADTPHSRPATAS